jgi:hypothetical protein
MGPDSVRRHTAVSGLLVLVVASVTSCSSPYERYMSEGCDGLRDSISALANGDREGFDESITKGGFSEPASEEAAGDTEKLRDIERLARAFNALSRHVYGSVETGEPPQELTSEDRDAIHTGESMCAEGY